MPQEIAGAPIVERKSSYGSTSIAKNTDGKYGQAPRNLSFAETAKAIMELKEMHEAYDEAWRHWVRANFLAIHQKSVKGAGILVIGATGGIIRGASKSGATKAKGQGVAEVSHIEEREARNE